MVGLVGVTAAEDDLRMLPTPVLEAPVQDGDGASTSDGPLCNAAKHTFETCGHRGRDGSATREGASLDSDQVTRL